MGKKLQSLPISVLALINPLSSTLQTAIEAMKGPQQESANAEMYS